MIKKFFLLFIIFGLFFGNIVNAGGRLDFPIIEENNNKIKYFEKIAKIGDLNIKYNIGFENQIPRGDIFAPIKIEFSQKINGILEIYKEKDKNYSNKNNTNFSKKLYKKIQIKNSDSLQTYFYVGNLEYRENFKFYLKINNEKILLSTSRKDSNDEELYILEKGFRYENFLGVNKIDDLFLLKQFERINLEKSNLSEKELQILKSYIFSGGKLILEKDLFEKYFGEDKKVKKIAYPKNYKEEKNINNKFYYEYGFGKIFFDKNDRYFFYNKNLFLNNNEVKKILIDKVIESKFVPFYVILIFVILYFISLLIVNFLLPLKYKNNKFFFFYGIPSVSAIFLILIIIISFAYRGFNDIENKLQINLHLDNKVLQQVYIANFSVFGGDYNLKIDKQDYLRQYIDYRYNRNAAKTEKIFNDNKIENKVLGLNSLSILYYKYANLVDEAKKSFSFKNIKRYKSKQDLLDDYKKDEEIKGYYYDDFNEGLKFSRKIEKIILKEEKTDFMKKYSYGGIENKNIVIDVFYK